MVRSPVLCHIISGGGFAGANTGSIIDCYARSEIVPGGYIENVGGFCGDNSGLISMAYSAFDIIEGVTGSGLGCFCGDNSGQIEYCYSAASQSYDNGNAVVLDSFEMAEQARYAGFDFANVWYMPASQSPVLRKYNGSRYKPGRLC